MADISSGLTGHCLGRPIDRYAVTAMIAAAGVRTHDDAVTRLLSGEHGGMGPMFAPNHSTYQVANHKHQERLSHAERMRLVARQNGPDGEPVDRMAHRRITARRMAAGIAGVVVALALTAVVTIGTVFAAPSGQSSGGGGVPLVR